jgi:hypothetical protein
LTVRTARPSGSIATAYRPLAAAFLAVSLLTACAGISRQELNSLGSEITPAAINFNELTDYGRRAKAVYGPETQISAAYPKTVRIAEPGTAKVRYFLERDESAKVQHLTIRGTANKRNLKEDMESRVRIDPSSGLPVHKGFEADARAVYADVKPHLQKGYGTRIAGHSLGGAVASLVAIYAIADGLLHRAILLTIGSGAAAALLIIVAFSAALLEIHHVWFAAVLFVVSMVLLLSSLLAFAMEVRIGLTENDHR